jgi:flagellar protein FliO/FliZ
MSGLLGSQLPMFAIAALVLVVAVIAAIFVVRRAGKGARREAGIRGRQGPRLAMIDSTPIIDGRKLVIVRRDDVEHLVLIGGATDVLIEANIRRSEPVEAVAAQPRETAPLVAADALPRVVVAEVPATAPEPEEITKEIPVPEAASWPAQSDSVQRLKRAADLAAETPVRPAAVEAPPAEPVAVRTPVVEPARAVFDEPAPALAAEPVKEQPASVPMDHFAELAAALQRPTAADNKASPARPAAASADADDQNLTDMAHRLEAALRRPVSSSGPGFVSMRTEPRRPFQSSGGSQRLNPTADLPRVSPRTGAEPRIAPEPRLVPEPRGTAAEPRMAPEPRIAPEPRVSGEPKSESGEDKPAFENLEREMASLLGRAPR